MAIAPGVFSKGRSASTTSQATTAVTTQASGSTFEVDITWDTGTFGTITDSKSNSYTQINTELAWSAGAAARFRRYRCENGTGGASHTVTVTFSVNSPCLVSFGETTGAATASFDTANRAEDISSPFTSPALSNAQAASLLLAGIGSDSGSGTATLAESTGMTVQSAATETNGASFYTGGMATLVVGSIASRNASFTQTGSSRAAVGLSIYKEATGGAATGKPWPIYAAMMSH